jgi:hypothetical protein
MEEYLVLTQAERDEMLLQNIKNEEKTLYSLRLQKAQYEEAIKDEPEGVKDAERNMLVEVNRRIIEIEKSSVGLYELLPKDEARIEAAKQAVEEKKATEITRK